MSIADNLKAVHAKIANACSSAGRSASSVRLVAVSKTQTLAAVREALSAGQKSFGENYVQEFLEKAAALPEVDWHYIGSLQTNKAKQIVGRCSLIHSVDRAKLALELGKAAAAAGVRQDVLLQIHVGDEETKHGVSIGDGPQLIDVINATGALRLRGVMAMPPLSDDERTARGYFAQVSSAFDRWRDSMAPDAARDFTELSLGTSSDYEWAIKEGATIVRVGTAIFGERKS